MKHCPVKAWFKFDPPALATFTPLDINRVLQTVAAIKERHIREMLGHWVSEEEPQVMERIMPNGGFEILGLGRVGCDDVIIKMPLICTLER